MAPFVLGEQGRGDERRAPARDERSKVIVKLRAAIAQVPCPMRSER